MLLDGDTFIQIYTQRNSTKLKLEVISLPTSKLPLLKFLSNQSFQHFFKQNIENTFHYEMIETSLELFSLKFHPSLLL